MMRWLVLCLLFSTVFSCKSCSNKKKEEIRGEVHPVIDDDSRAAQRNKVMVDNKVEPVKIGDKSLQVQLDDEIDSIISDSKRNNINKSDFIKSIKNAQKKFFIADNDIKLFKLNTPACQEGLDDAINRILFGPILKNLSPQEKKLHIEEFQTELKFVDDHEASIDFNINFDKLDDRYHDIMKNTNVTDENKLEYVLGMQEKFKKEYDELEEGCTTAEEAKEKTEKSLKAKIDQEEKDLKDKKDQDEKYLKANKDQEEKTLKAKKDQEEKVLKAKKDQEGKTLKAYTDQQEKTLKAKKDQEEKALKAKTDQEEKALKAKNDQEEKDLKDKKDKKEKTLKAKKDQNKKAKKEQEMKENARKDAETESNNNQEDNASNGEKIENQGNAERKTIDDSEYCKTITISLVSAAVVIIGLLSFILWRKNYCWIKEDYNTDEEEAVEKEVTSVTEPSNLEELDSKTSEELVSYHPIVYPSVDDTDHQYTSEDDNSADGSYRSGTLDNHDQMIQVNDYDQAMSTTDHPSCNSVLEVWPKK